MDKIRTIEKDTRARIEYVPRSNAAVQKKKQSIDHEQASPPTNATNTISIDHLPSISYKTAPTNPATERSSDEYNNKRKISQLPSLNIVSPVSPSIDDNKTPKLTKTSDHGLRKWYNHLTTKQKLLLKLMGMALIASAIVLLVVLPIYFTVIRRKSESSFTNITVSVCSSSTCIGKETPYRTTMVNALYPFDGNYNDITGYATGIPYGLAISSVAYTGYMSQAVYLTLSTPQYIQIPYINLSKRSFTLQAWVYPGTLNATNDLGIFSQCDTNMICLSLSIRSARFTLLFDSMNASSNVLIGTTIVSTNNWFHVTVVYDATRWQQQIYVNGKIDAISNGIINSFQGSSSGSTTIIGRTLSLSYGASYYNGRIDHFTISGGTTRSACQIYNDATLLAYYPFDSSETWNDYSVNLCNGIGVGTTTISIGRFGQAVSFTSSTSYFQAQCFPKLRSYDLSFSISLWINPTSVIPTGSLVHMSTNANGAGNCYDLLAFTSTGFLVCQWMLSSGPNVNSTLGPQISSNTWTHIAVVYSNTNGMRLFVNGQFVASSSNSGNLNLYDFGALAYITLANVGSSGPPIPASCLVGSIPLASGSFLGVMDEFRLYNRELDTQEICVLANL
ncbi:hypothetical protein I4U23_024765 [Adineta vaga]|nr:hypothetical protein I4U23_024765 [Adineta vaga]